MNLGPMKDALKKLKMERHFYEHAASVLDFDGNTIAPRASAPCRGEAAAFLSQKQYELLTRAETRELLQGLWECRDELDEVTAREVYLLGEEVRELTRIPMDEYTAYSKLCTDSVSAWLKAKEQNDYALFEPFLAQIIAYTRRFAAYRNASLPAYEVLLDSYEKGLNTQTLDAFFGMLRNEIVPLMEQSKKQKPLPAFVSAPCDLNAQRAFSDELMQLLGLDRSRCAIAETEHPFTTSMNRDDVRITTHYYPNAFLSSMYSVIHEGGHAHYDLGVAEEYLYSPVGSVSSMSLHESQSRFYENLIGHDQRFLSHVAPRLRELFPALAGITDRELFLAANYVQPSLIRTEADQVTYPLHIMVRYELEKQLIDGSLSTRDLPRAWNALYKEYLGVDVPNDSMGVMQDVHWPSGMFGYFPSYALGSAYASQILHALKKEIDFDLQLEKGDLSPITGWLNEHIHRYGNLYDPGVMLQKATGEAFNPAYYVTHLKNVIQELLKG